MIFRRSTGKAVRSTMKVIHRLCHLVSYLKIKDEIISKLSSCYGGIWGEWR